MFGMEKQKSKEKEKPFLFDLEVELKDKDKARDYAKRIEDRINKIKGLLRHGGKKEEYDQLGILLNGYHALAVVLGRSTQGTSKQ